MNLIILSSILTSIFFGVLAIYFSLKKEHASRPPSFQDDFIHMMIHELRAPLTAIKGAAELILRSDNKINNEEQTKMVQLIHDQSKKLLDQVSSLLDFAKIQASQFTIQKIPTEIGKLIDESLAVFKPEAENKKITLLTQIPADLPIVLADQLRITQVINNLVSNSLKFTPVGGNVSITVKAQNLPKKQISVSVSDTGTGIPDEKQKDLFTKFYQVQNNGADGITAGSGLGLYIVKHIIDAHQGDISLVSEPGKGTTITFTIPL